MKNALQIFCIALSFFIQIADRADAASSEWATVHGGAVRLISSGSMEGGHYKAAIEFALEPGWHTYWRYPGEAGVPLEASFEASENIDDVSLKYPMPERHTDGFSTSIVYQNAITLPLEIRPTEKDQPSSLAVTLNFGMCSDICVPASASLKLSLSPNDSQDRISALLIERDLMNIPGTLPPLESRITSLQVSKTDNGRQLIIHARVNTTDKNEIDLFAEGPTGSYIGVPVFKTLENGLAQWSLSLNGLSVNEDGTSQLVLTLKDGDYAEESTHKLSAAVLSD